MTEYRLPPDARIGHVHLRVADLERATAFYRDLLGFEVTMDLRPVGVPAGFPSAGGYHHHVALNTVMQNDALDPRELLATVAA
jgi:catechol 2,3-dioxygenase